MCILLWTLDNHPRYRFIFAGNRDEYLNRPTAEAHFWAPPFENIIAGTDLEQHNRALPPGTWLGMTRNGRFAALTNYREPMQQSACSRGPLVSDYLTSNTSVDAYIDQVSKSSTEFRGFSLVCLDILQSDMSYYSNRDDANTIPLSKGVIYGLSNSVLTNPWKKVVDGRKQFERVIRETANEEDDLINSLFDLLSQEKPFPPNLSAEQAIMELREKICVPLINLPNLKEHADYATRTNTVILVDYNNTAIFAERNLYKPSNNNTSFERIAPKENRFRFKISLD